MKTIIRFLKSEEGATAVEYAVMVSLILAVVIGAVAPVGQKSSTALSNFDSGW